jgi:hypothetical protein
MMSLGARVGCLHQPSRDGTHANPGRFKTRVRLFNLSLVKKPARQPDRGEPKSPVERLTFEHAQLSGPLRVGRQSKKDFFVGNGNIEVGNKSATRKSRQPIVEGLAAIDGPSQLKIDQSVPLKSERPRICRAMSQQCGDNGNASAPQKFVHLVGCRDPKARPEPWIHPRPAAVKQQS